MFLGTRFGSIPPMRPIEGFYYTKLLIIGHFTRNHRQAVIEHPRPLPCRMLTLTVWACIFLGS